MSACSLLEKKDFESPKVRMLMTTRQMLAKRTINDALMIPKEWTSEPPCEERRIRRKFALQQD